MKFRAVELVFLKSLQNTSYKHRCDFIYIVYIDV